MISSREDGIVEAGAETCSWVWGDQPSDETSGIRETPTSSNEFMPWLQSADQFFWISGKAGCGKSTLMKYMYHHPKTKLELERSEWACGKDLILVGHFIHDRGTDDQKSREGMLRSILYQVLSERRDLIPAVFPPGGFFDDNNDNEAEHPHKLNIANEFLDWSCLISAFNIMLEQLRDSRICLFLDGLDEYRLAGREGEYSEEQKDLLYDGGNEDDAWGRSGWITEGHREVARFLRGLSTRSNVKACIASRELVVFEHEFRNFPRLVVHTHTAEAIAKYCQGRLAEEAPGLERFWDGFGPMITDKACGVFLWVQLVVDMLVDGYISGDDLDELQKAMEKLPSRLGGKNGLYMHMMQSIVPGNLPESRRVFELVLRWGDIKTYGWVEAKKRNEGIDDMLESRVTLTMAYEFPHPDIAILFLAAQGHLQDDTTQELRASSDGYDFRTWDEWEDRRKHLGKRLKSRCGGLLEATDTGKVQFMHQTAKQFILNQYLWPAIFRNAVGFATEADTNLALMSGLIRRLKCCSEAVFVGHLSPNSETRRKALLQHDLPDKFDPEAPFSWVLCEILVGLINVASLFNQHPRPPDDVLQHYTRLLDELDCVGNRLTRNLRASEHAGDLGWPGVDLVIDYPDAFRERNVRLKSGSDFAIFIGNISYMRSREDIKRPLGPN